MLVGFGVAYQFYIRSPGNAEGASPRTTGALYHFLLNKWYFDELYDFLFVRPAKRLGPFLWKKRRRLADRRLRPGRRLGAGHRRHQPGGQAADRLSLSLRLRHADRRRRARHLDDARELALMMTDWPILSHGHLPAAGRRVADPAHPRRGRRRAPQHPQHRAADHGLHLRAVAVHLGRLRQCRSGLPVRREGRLAGFAASPTTWASTAFRCCSSS